MGDKECIAWGLFNLAGQDSSEGEYTRARVLFEESLAIHRELGNYLGFGSSLFELAKLLFVSRGDSATMRSLLEEEFTLAREMGDKEMIAFCTSFSGQVALSQGDAATARLLLEESLELWKELGNRRSIAQSLSHLASVAAAAGDYVTARVLYEEGLAIFIQADHKQWIAVCLEGLATVVAAQGELSWAARLWGTAEALRKAIGAPLPPVERPDYEHAVATAGAQLGEKDFAAAWAEGRTMTPEQVLIATEPLSASSTKPRAPYPDGLTAREVEVLRLVAQGLSNAEIAEQLIISLLTVKAHMRSLYNKLGISSRSAATRYAIEHHLM
jgi:ATP/maltotriose-dependent transcriptional regulator MalT